MSTKVITLEVVEMETGRVVDEISCNHEREAEQVMRGLLMKVDTDRYMVRYQK